ncbi:hypothetical protein CFP65_4591 [Kitasatospora sp. MMS16-BH015]|uniref:DUF2079 domain-containing protein n=1 Tax=Kitasatospora sp. MMS16-BH015 TaxID=2018025 RepID=UPI000CA37080|nr:DUF2079 domain-containing protein [Kitasatospora sp. MMS16-BH015]AUG79328.1 hypothetical protein CFP65_4591 [Kitasatospora sp. MMS16-BH015]
MPTSSGAATEQADAPAALGIPRQAGSQQAGASWAGPREPQRTTSRRRARRRTLLLMLLCAGVSFALGLQQWTAVQIGGFDLSIFDQGIRGYAHFGLPISEVKSYHHEFPPGFSLLGDHFSPVLALLAPLYWVWNDPRTLMLGQALLFAAGVPLVRRIALRCFAPVGGYETTGTGREAARRAADLAGLVYALGWPLLTAAKSGFHEVAFAVPLTLLMFERGMARRYGTMALAALLLCGTKEDMGLLVGAYGLVLLLRSRRARDPRGLGYGIGLLVGGPVAAALAIGWLVPAMGGQPGYYWNYGSLGPDAGSALRNVLADPSLLLQDLFSTPVKSLLVLWLFGTLLLLPLRSATTLCALPLLTERVLSDNPNHWPITHHYDAFLWPVLLTAALEALGRLHAREPQRRTARRLGLTVAACSLVAAVPLGIGGLLLPTSWTPKPSAAAMVRAAELIPDGATVEADNQVVPRLAARTDAVLVDGTPRGRAYVLIRPQVRTFPFQSAQQQADRVALLLAHGYRQIWAEDGVVLLHRESTEPVPGEHVPGPGSKPVQDVVPKDVGRNLFRG